MECKKCGNVLPENAKFCFECGAKVEKEWICATCGSKMPANYKFCMECGSVLSDSVKNMLEKEKTETDNVEIEEEDWDKILRAFESENSVDIRHDTWWSDMYGSKDWVMYKGYLYGIVPEYTLTGRRISRREHVKNWMIVRLDIDNGEREILKKINKDNYPRGLEFSFEKRYGSFIPFTICNSKIYYGVDQYGDESGTKVIIFDIDSKEETTTTIKQNKKREYRILGIFKGYEEEVCIKYEEDNKNAYNYISDLNGQRKKKLLSTGEYVEKIVAYNESYVYYTGNGDQLYVVNLETFEVINLSRKLTKLQKNGFYGVDPRMDVIYFMDGDKMKSVNMNNEVVEELLMPKVPNYITLGELDERKQQEKRAQLENLCHSYNKDDTGLFFNGEYWLFKINPEKVGNDMKGLILFDKDGKEQGVLLSYKMDGGYVAQSQMHFMLPTAIVVMDKIVNEDGVLQTMDFSTNGSGPYAWHGNIYSVTEGNLENTGNEIYEFFND